MNRHRVGAASFLAVWLAAATAGARDDASRPGPWMLPAPRDVRLGGPLGAAFRLGVERLGQDPYRSVPFLRSDVSFEVERWFTNYSGDISGRFIEIASLTSPRGKMQPGTLAELLETITKYQKPDGHFGIEVDWKKALELPNTRNPRMLPIFWGNGRLLVGLVTAYETFGIERLIASAKALGDFYIATADDLMNPARDAEYRATGTYAPGYVTDYFPGIEGLARLYQATKEGRYLKQAERMAEFFKPYDKLPLDHSHGNLVTYHGLILLHEITGKPEYLQRAVARWEEAVSGGYIWPTGGLAEAFKPVYPRDEGCSEADWLRLNLDLWRATGQTRYLDMAERLLRNHYAMNRAANGGYGHHDFVNDETGPVLVSPKFVEAAWCCTFHGLMGMDFLKGHIVAGSERGVFVNFPFAVEAPLRAAGRDCKVSVEVEESTRPRSITCRVRVEPREGAAPPLFIRVPDWADNAIPADATGGALPAQREAGYLKIAPPADGHMAVAVTFTYSPRVEDRRLHRLALKPGGGQQLREVVLFDGPRMLLANTDKPRPAISAAVDAKGTLRLSASTPRLTDWHDVNRETGAAFVFDLTTTPE